MKVLIAEDDPVSRRLLQTYLERWGYEVTVAENGAEAWRLFQESDFPLVISDWMMPEMDGVELVRHIRSRDLPGYVYTILLTAKSEKEDLVQGMEAGADDFVSKPFDRDELRVRLREGERIITLERNLAEQNTALREIQGPISILTEQLTMLRRELERSNDTSLQESALQLIDESLHSLARVRDVVEDFSRSPQP